MQAMRSGVREFLSQPIDPMVVREMLERLVKQRGIAARRHGEASGGGRG